MPCVVVFTRHAALVTFVMIELAPNHKHGLALQNPVMNAAGVLGFAGEYRGLIDFAQLGAFVTNPITATPRTPAHGPNVFTFPNGVLIHTGLPNPGVRSVLRQYSREWARLGPPVIVHLAATTPEDVQRSVERLERADGVSGIELGLRDEISFDETYRLVRAGLGGPPLIVRLSLMRAEELCMAIAEAGADALTVAAPPRRSVPVNGRTVSGRFYSPENFAAALEAVRAVVGTMHTARAPLRPGDDSALPLPIIGAGGIDSIEDARAMLDAGAVAVQVDAAAWVDPRILNQLELE